ncbi:hypothetical protein EOT10_06115 [Streptomyces antnestii]|uniref:Uncharacterized protein n=1 Tax=Streptomyces antnestii TaxID=2494256 RepID=A0A437Q013_9ACTN|nr:hypothetical protein [Streptomyces sp. San01]RVU27857.1 hypothetical protein EOT10_06115 [Streptomyces sp. San01]
MTTQGSQSTEYLRFQATAPNERGHFTGIFGLVNRLGRAGKLSEEQERFRRANNAWYDAAYPDPGSVDPSVYDPEVNPTATAWFKPTATHLLDRVGGYLEILAAHGVECRLVRSADPGRVIYEDDVQIVVVTRDEPAAPPDTP